MKRYRQDVSRWRMTIQVDARMIESSGIGVVIRSILSRLIGRFSEYRFLVLLPSHALQKFDWLEKENVVKFPWDAPVYSIKEHFCVLPSKGIPVDITWVPHYNVSAAIVGPIIATIHDILHIESAIVRRSAIQSIYARLMFQWVRRRCDGVHFVSQATRDAFHQKIGVATNEMVIWNGVDPAWFESIQSQRKSNQMPYVVFVGNGFPHKNLVRLIHAVKIAREKTPLELKIVGNFTGLRTIDQAAIRVAEENCDFVELKGKLNFDELRAVVAQSAALAFPSLYEGFGLPPLEALAQGVPVVVSSIPVHHEIFTGGAHFVDPYSEASIAEGILNAICDQDPREKRIAFAKRYDWSFSAERVSVLISSITEGMKGKAR